MELLYIAEKKDAGKALVEYLSKKTGKPIQTAKFHASVGQYTVAWLKGHTLGLIPPEGYDPRFKNRNDFSVLPIFPEHFVVEPSSDTAPYISNIRDLLKVHDTVIHFGDPDREGQLIVDEVLYFLKNKKPVKRLWAASLDDKSLQTALDSIQSNSQYARVYQSALARSHADWVYGINMSRAVTIAARKKGSTTFFSTGRVQTPTLALVVNREEAITNFTPVDYFVPWIDVTCPTLCHAFWKHEPEDSRLDPLSGKLTDLKIAKEIQDQCQRDGKATVTSYSIEPGVVPPPLMFSTSSLQVLCSALFGISPKETLQIASSLYLKKITSYPRTSCEYLPESQLSSVEAIFTSLAKSPLPTTFAKGIRGSKQDLKSRAWDDKKVSPDKTAHHAITILPLDNPAILAELSPIELAVYGEIAKRFITQFWPSAKYQTTKVKFSCGSEIFGIDGRKYTDDGWKAAFETPAEQTDEAETPLRSDIPSMKVGDVFPITGAGFESLATKPPKRFTQATLLQEMESISKYVLNPEFKKRLTESSGIGTSATRADIIAGLIDKELLQEDKKFVVPSSKGSLLIKALPVDLTSPDMTAMWEVYMDSILQGKSSYESFMHKQKAWLTDLVASSVDYFADFEFPKDPNAPQQTISEHRCSKCGKPLKHILYKGSWFFACTDQENCKTTYRDEGGLPVAAKPKAPPSGIKCPTCRKNDLVRRKSSKDDGFFWGCSGWLPKNKGCSATFQDQDGQPVLVTTGSNVQSSTGQQTSANTIQCPGCKNGTLMQFRQKPPKTGTFWGCSRWKDGCKTTFEDANGSPNIEGKAASLNTVQSPNKTRAPESTSVTKSSPHATLGEVQISPSSGITKYKDILAGRGTFSRGER